MQKLFGTDGIRDKIDSQIFKENFLINFSIQIELYLRNYILNKYKNRLLKNDYINIAISRDTRLSGISIQKILTDAFMVIGINSNLKVFNYEVLPTPLFANVIMSKYDLGIMITASHNPYTDNGIKIFNEFGEKISKNDELLIEPLLHKKLPEDTKNNFYKSYNIFKNKKIRYADYDFTSHYPNFTLKPMSVVIDSANGATSGFVNNVFTSVKRFIYNNNPDGKNINLNCGSEYPEEIAKKVLENNADIGIAFDGDGDRLTIIDEKGNILTGDHIMSICAKYYLDNNLLKNKILVTTCMSNLGLTNTMKNLGISLIITDVGDRNVANAMNEYNAILGGENSGHIIFKEYCSSGDGMLTALILLNILSTSNQSLSELASILDIYPQKLINIPITSKPSLKSLVSLNTLIELAEDEFNSKGRVLVRYSGTELICRVMVEGENEKLVNYHSKNISSEVRKLIGL